jgi:hypothetical protein
LGAWIEAGQSLADFWQSTPRQWVIITNAYYRRRAFATYHAGWWQVKDSQMADFLPADSASRSAPMSDEAREAHNMMAFAIWEKALGYDPGASLAADDAK